MRFRHYPSENRSFWVFFHGVGFSDLSELSREVLVHCRLVHCGLVHCRLELFFLRISDSIDVFSCVGRLKRVLFASSEKGVCRQYRPSPWCIRCIYRLLASMALLFQESSTLLYGLRWFLLVSHLVNTIVSPWDKQGKCLDNNKTSGNIDIFFKRNG